MRSNVPSPISLKRITRCRAGLFVARSLLFSLALFLGCVQHTFEPTQVNTHVVRIETLKPTGAISKNVAISLFEDNTPGSKLVFDVNTGDSGVVTFRLDIPTFGHDYSLRVRKDDALGQLLYARTIFPLRLKCVDTTVIIIIPEPDTAIARDSLCGTDASRTLTFFACADTLVSQVYTIKNCGSTQYTLTPGALTAPFSIQPSTPVTLNPGEVATFIITYDGRGQTNDASSQLKITSAPASGNATLTLVGHLRHDCNIIPQHIVCGQNSISDSVRFGTVCQNQVTSGECVSFVNSNNVAVTVTSFPAAPTPYSYTVTDNAGAQHDLTTPLTLKPGESMTICVAINPTVLGASNSTLDLPMQCQGGSAFAFRIPLSAFVKACNNCICADYFHAPVVIATNVRVGTDTVVTAEIFHNDLNCPVTIGNLTKQNPTSDWAIVSTTPSLPTTVAPGGTITATVHFKPSKAGKLTDHLHVDITPAGASTPCKGDVELIGTGCNSVCADIVMPPEWLPSPPPNGPDTLFFKQGGIRKILVSAQGTSSLSDPECITVKYADTGCATKSISIVAPKSNLWSVTTTPTPLTLSPGASGQICVTFTAPTLTQVRKDFTLPNLELKYTDVLQILDPEGCTKVVPLKAVVDTLPACKEFDLAQYDLVGTGQVVYRESYLFDAGRRDNVPPAGSGAPSIGDMYLKAAAQISNPGGPVPTGFFFWKNDQLPICNNIPLVTSQLTALGPKAQTYNAALAVAKFDWLVVWVRPGVYAVIQVSALYVDGFNIPHVVFDVLYPFYF